MRFESRRGKNEKNEKKHMLQSVKMYFLYNFFLASPLALHFQDDL